VSLRRVALWGPFLAALALGFTLSSMQRVPGAEFFWDKLLHVTEFAGIGVLALRAFHGGVVPPRRGPTLSAGAAVVLWALSDEFHQSFVPGRDASLRDVAADVVGFAVASGLFYAFTKWREASR
jgi:VanZ family protein